MTLLAIVVALAMSAVLLRAASEKLRGPAALAATIRALGVPSPMTGPAAATVIAAELIIAVALLFRPDSPLTQLAVVLLAALFALAGLAALRLEERVSCSCFGSGRDGYLGVPQLVAFVPWTAGAAILHFGARPMPFAAAAALFAVVALGLAVVRVTGVWSAMNEARGDRRSAEEMYKWLPSH